jgi:ketosteroid isomerase-like protein
VSDPTGNVAIVQQTYEAVGRGDISAVLDVLTDDVEWTLQGPTTIPFAGTRHGHEGVADFFAQIAQSLEFELFEPYDMIGQGDTVVAIGRERSRSTASGHAVVQEWAHVYTLTDGKISRFRAFEDTAALDAVFNGG